MTGIEALKWALEVLEKRRFDTEGLGTVLTSAPPQNPGVYYSMQTIRDRLWTLEAEGKEPCGERGCNREKGHVGLHRNEASLWGFVGR